MCCNDGAELDLVGERWGDPGERISKVGAAEGVSELFPGSANRYVAIERILSRFIGGGVSEEVAGRRLDSQRASGVGAPGGHRGRLIGRGWCGSQVISGGETTEALCNSVDGRREKARPRGDRRSVP